MRAFCSLLLFVVACSSQTQTTTAPTVADGQAVANTTPAAIEDRKIDPADPVAFPKATKENQTRAKELVERGRAVLKDKGTAGATEAVALFSEAAKADARNAAALWELGWAYQAAGDFDSALKSWETLRTLDPKFPDLDSFTSIATTRRGERAAAPEPVAPPPPKKPAPRRADMKTDLAR